jgi:hypothetical protein
VREEYHKPVGTGLRRFYESRYGKQHFQAIASITDSLGPNICDNLSPEVRNFLPLKSFAPLGSILITLFCLPLLGQSAPAQDAEAGNRQGMPPRSSPADYQSQEHVGTVTIAAEFMRHSVPTPEGVYSTEDYVVVETALFGEPQARLNISASNFSLRINGKKKLFASQPYALVAASLKDPSWVPPAPPEKSKTSFGSGGQAGDSPPPVVHAPMSVTHTMDQHVEKAVMPEGDRVLPEAGLLFFEYRGKDKGIHSVELLYEGPAGKTSLELRP